MTLRICIDARLVDGESGGIQQCVIGLANGFSQLRDGDEEYYFLTYRGADAWLRPHINGNCHILSGPPVPFRKHFKRQRLGRFVHWLAHRIGSELLVSVPVSDGTVEKAGIDLIHFVPQTAFLTNLPTIYMPWDLQFMAYPQYFTPRERAFRSRLYRVFCQSARVVVTCTPWGKEDLVRRMNLPPDKIDVVPLAPATDAYEKPSQADLDATRSQFSLPTKFIFYPAHTWPHKNHIGLVEAISLLAKNGLRVPVILSGGLTPHAEIIRQRAVALGVDDLIFFLGFVPPLVVRTLFELAWGMVFPSLYEGWGLPVQEAMRAGCPVACADATTLPYVAQGGALLFDPLDPQNIANAIEVLWHEETLRSNLIEKGYRAVSEFNWERTARMFRELYRKMAHGR